MKTTGLKGKTLGLILLFLGLNVAVAWGQDIPRMSIEQLQGMLGNPDVVVLDVRTAKDWDSGKTKITGALRMNPGDVETWAKDLDTSKTYVLYCA